MEAAFLGAGAWRRGPSSSDGKNHGVGSRERRVRPDSRRNVSQPLARSGEFTDRWNQESAGPLCFYFSVSSDVALSGIRLVCWLDGTQKDGARWYLVSRFKMFADKF